MTATIGHPTLRLIRIQIGRFQLNSDLPPGHWTELTSAQRQLILS
jgi:23S rRNA pseudouridine2457 synthase